MGDCTGDKLPPCPTPPSPQDALLPAGFLWFCFPWPHWSASWGWMCSYGKGVLHSNSLIGKSPLWSWVAVPWAIVWNFLSPERFLGLRPDIARLIYRWIRGGWQAGAESLMRRQLTVHHSCFQLGRAYGKSTDSMFDLNFSPWHFLWFKTTQYLKSLWKDTKPHISQFCH